MNKVFSFIFLVSIFFSNAQEKSINDFSFPIDRDQLKSQELIYRMSQNGDSLGYSKIKIEMNESAISIHEESKVSSSFKMTEEMSSFMNVKNLIFNNVNLKGVINNNKFEGTVKYFNRRLKGRSNYTLLNSNKEAKIDSIISIPFVERLASLFLFPPLIDFEVSKEYNYLQFNVNDCKFRSVIIKRTTSQTISGPRGVFDTYKLELTGGVAEQVLFISKEYPKRIVRIEFKNTKWVYELLN